MPVSSPEYLGTRLKILESGNPGSGISLHYPENKNKDLTPVLIAGGVEQSNLMIKIADAQTLGWNVLGFDVASALEEAQESNVKIFSAKKVAEFVSLIAGKGR